MSERSGSPCSERNGATKRKKIYKGKYEQSQKISQHGQSKITHFFRNVQKRVKADPKPTQRTLMALQSELESLKEQQQQLLFQKQQIIQQQLQMKQQNENWIRRSRELVQECICQIYQNKRKRKSQIDPQKGFYDQNYRVFNQGIFGQYCQAKKKNFYNILVNEQYKDQAQMSMVQELYHEEQQKLRLYRKQLNNYKQRLKNSYQEKTCKFVDIWPLLANRYQVLELLGKGGFSQVYKAYDLQQNKYIAIKRSSTIGFKPELTHYIIRQYQNHIKLQHPNIAQLYQVVQATSNSVCIALEYCQGPQLSSYIKEQRTIPQIKAKNIIKEIFQALRYLSSLDPRIIHFDLKPQNIMFNEGRVKILDFGLSKQIDNEHSRIALTNQGVGTYWYLPPQAFHEKSPQISEKVDIWSAGVILYEMLFGRKPFGHNKSQSTIMQEGIILDANKVQFPDDIQVSQNAKSLIRHCLAYNPNQRFNSHQALSHNFFKS